jgi:hypothetical protein
MTRQARLKSKGPSQTRKNFTSYKVNFHLIWSPQGCHRGVVNSKKYPYTPVFLMKKYEKIWKNIKNIKNTKSFNTKIFFALHKKVALNMFITIFRVLKRRIFALNVKMFHLIWRTHLNNLKISVFFNN